MIHASVFSGIGGPEVAAAMLGWKNAFHCEINPFGRSVLEYWFPESESYEDITKTDFYKWRGKVDVLTGGFPCQPFSYAGKRGGGETITVTSGRRCIALLAKSGPLGSLLRMLLASPLWSKEGYSLTWDVKQLCSTRMTTFTDMCSGRPSPSRGSARISNVSDIQSSRLLFRLRVSGPLIKETESSSSRIMMLKTPTAFDAKDQLPKSAAQTSSTGTLAQEIQNGYAAKRGLLLPTPTAGEATKYRLTYKQGSQMGESLSAMAGSGMLPTPTARDYKNPSSPDGKRIQRKKNQNWTIELSDLAAMKMLPMPSARDWQPPYNEDAMVRKNGMVRDDQLCSLPTMLGLKERGGISFRLSPLFTEEMMGFPFLWTTLPFLSRCPRGLIENLTKQDSTAESGEPSRSKPTETPSSRK